MKHYIAKGYVIGLIAMALSSCLLQPEEPKKMMVNMYDVNDFVIIVDFPGPELGIVPKQPEDRAEQTAKVDSVIKEKKDRFLQEIKTAVAWDKNTKPGCSISLNQSGLAVTHFPAMHEDLQKELQKIREKQLLVTTDLLFLQVTKSYLKEKNLLSDKNALALSQPEVNTFLSEIRDHKLTKLSAPRLTVFDSQRTHITILKQENYIEDYTFIKDGDLIKNIEPVLKTFQTGSVLEIKPLINKEKNYITMHILWKRAQSQEIRNVKHPILGEQYMIQQPAVRQSTTETTAIIPQDGCILLTNFDDQFKDEPSAILLRAKMVKKLNYEDFK